jgi:hypothetical protein
LLLSPWRNDLNEEGVSIKTQGKLLCKNMLISSSSRGPTHSFVLTDELKGIESARQA